MPSHRLVRFGVWFITAVFTATNSLAGAINLANEPLVNGLTNPIKPNVLFIFDDSLSMDYEYMPDGISSSRNRACYRNFGYNTIYYNPYETYLPPVRANGTSYPNAVFTSAYDNGFDTTSARRDLSASTTDYEDVTTVYGPNNLGSNPFTTSNNSRNITVAYNSHGLKVGDRVRFTRSSGSGSVSFNNVTIQINTWYEVTSVTNANSFVIRLPNNTSSNANRSGTGGGSNLRIEREITTQVATGSTPNVYYTIYTQSPGSPPSTCQTDSAYTRVYPANGTEAEKQNYANWYSYYRSRLLLMKTAAGRAFQNVTDDFRVGFTVISDRGTSTSWLGVKRFDATQKANWYSTLYAVRTSGYTPLRGALSKAGRYYAGVLGGTYAAGQDNDPIQYSCQQNFSILTTDGYWNTNEERTTNPKYGPYQINNTDSVGNADGNDGTPYADTYSNTLADVAAYYYKTDLRPDAGVSGVKKGARVDDDGQTLGLDVTTNNVADAVGDGRRHQRMRTFTLGLGVDGKRNYPGDWGAIQGGLGWPDPINNDEEERIDDLWHAAVNGRGQYMSARNANSVEAQLRDALNSIKYESGSAAAAATSTLQPVEGDNTAYLAQYQTGNWVGDLLARSVDVVTGAISTTDIWSAQAKLDAKVGANGANHGNRNIYTFSSSAANGLKSFTAANLVTEIALGYFNSSGSAGHAALSQWSEMNATRRDNATPQAMIEYLRGKKSHEMSGAVPAGDAEVFRRRLHTLGDIGSAAPVYVRKPPMNYLDTGYAAYISSKADRAGTVYVGSNDGMLHAFNGAGLVNGVADPNGGEELWAYIPSMVMPNLYKLADGEYAANHRYYVDGPIVVGDAYNSAAATPYWATILVGGLGHGGRGYYALDVSDPASPKALWEFDVSDDPDIGYSYGNPIITKMEDGDGNPNNNRWVVLFASGYNNSENGTGDGRGRLYVVDAFSGDKLAEIITDSSLSDPNLSGIARISNYVEDGRRDNSTRYVYGGDLSGALWRFDIQAGTRVRLGRTTSTPGQQPITVQPELAKINLSGTPNWVRVVYFGTGRALGPNDLTSSDPANDAAQAIYAVKDTGTDIGIFSNPDDGELVQQSLRDATQAEIDSGKPWRKTDPPATVDWSNDNGWFVTTPVGERFTVDPGLQLGTLVMAANIYENGYCEPTGSSVLYQMDYRSGSVLMTTEYSAQVVGITQLQTRGGAGPVVIDPVFADGTTGNTPQVGTGSVLGGARRVTWREIE